MLHWLELKLRLGAELDASDGKTLLVRAVTGGAFGDWCRTQNLERAFRIQQNVWRKSWFVPSHLKESDFGHQQYLHSIAWIHPFAFLFFCCFSDADSPVRHLSWLSGAKESLASAAGNPKRRPYCGSPKLRKSTSSKRLQRLKTALDMYCHVQKGDSLKERWNCSCSWRSKRHWICSGRLAFATHFESLGIRDVIEWFLQFLARFS